MGKLQGKIASVFSVLFFLYCYTACMLITAMFLNIYMPPTCSGKSNSISRSPRRPEIPLPEERPPGEGGKRTIPFPP